MRFDEMDRHFVGGLVAGVVNVAVVWAVFRFVLHSAGWGYLGGVAFLTPIVVAATLLFRRAHDRVEDTVQQIEAALVNELGKHSS